VHTPASIVSDYGGDTDENWARFIDELEALPADIKVVGINDYWFLDGYRRVLEAKADNRLGNLEAIFPVVEMRIEQFGGVDGNLSRVNVHVIFDPDLGITVIEQQFLGQLHGKFKLSAGKQSGLWDGAITRESLADLGRKIKESVPPEKLGEYGSDLEEGFNNVNVSFEHITNLIAGEYLAKRALVGIGKTEWADIKWNNQSVASKKHVISSADLLFTAFADSSNWGSQVESLRSAKVNHRLLDCSDAHYWSDSDQSMRIGNCNTWINSTPTFVGLVHALKEFDHRVFVGLEPPARARTNEHPERFIDSISISSSAPKEHPAFSYSLPLNPGFVAVVGNKGQGKSALLDIIALAGNSSRNGEFAFLTPRRFLAGGGKAAANYTAVAEWATGAKRSVRLNDAHDKSGPVSVEYLPQAFVERICSADPSTGEADEFESELREILFTHIPEDDRAGERSFNGLLERKTRAGHDVVERLRGGLKPLIRSYAEAAQFQAANTEVDVNSKLSKKRKELSAAKGDLKTAEAELAALDVQSAQDSGYEKLKAEAETLSSAMANLVGQKEPIERNLAKAKQDRLTLDAIEQRLKSLGADAALVESDAQVILELVDSDRLLVFVDVDTARLEEWKKRTKESEIAWRAEVTELEAKHAALISEQAVVANSLTASDSRRELARQKVIQGRERVRSVTGTEEDIESLEGLLGIKRQVEAAPAVLAAAREQLLGHVKLILEAIETQLASVASMYQPASEFIAGSATISKASLEFRAGLQVTPRWYTLQSQIDGRKSPSLGNWMGELPDRLEAVDWLNIERELADLILKLETERAEPEGAFRDPNATLRAGVTVDSLLLDICDLNWIDVRFGLTGEGLPLAQLSPGQRGLVLALFYLVVDTRTTPLLLDQPEENLDNETITSLLVPAIREAAGRRQTIVVTHNPNLAIVGDADQIVHCQSKDRVFSVESGAISEIDVARFAVNILEGTKPAFDARKVTYESFPAL